NYTATPPSSLYTFTPPSGTASGDVFSWDFGDGNTSAASSPQNTYQSAGTYLVSLCIQRPQPNGDTCKVKLCQQIVVQTCRQCVQYINANPVDLAVDMSAWSSGSGPVTFYPTTSFAPFNVRITWDFNCDGKPDQVTSGNSPVTFNFPCGPKTICYTVECLQSQQVICSTKSFRKTFNIPCPQNQSECPNLVINGDFTAGDNGSFSSPSLAPNCTGACGTGAYCVGDNFKDKCNLWPNSVDHTTGSGNFMSIDGVSGGTGPFQVWKQIAPITVQPNTTYKFCFWVKSVYPFAQQQQLVLESVIKDANGNPLKSMPHPIRQTTPMWTEYCMIWNSGSNTSVQLVIEQMTAGAFRDFGIDDISFCCVDCADFMTDAMDFGIQGTRVSGNTYKFCLSSNISANDIVKWDLDCNGTIDATTHCATFTLTPSNTQICATVYHVIKPGDTCRVKLNTCLPDVVNTDSCTCQSPIFENDVKAGFSWVKNPPYTVTFTPYGLLDKCDKVQWSFGNASAQANSVGNASVSYTYPSTPGSYSVCMFVTRTEPNGTICKREFCLLIKLDGTVGLTEVGLSKLTVNPNPTHNSVSISVPNALFNRKHLLRLTTIDGKVVKSMAIESAEMKMDMEMLPAGLYFLYLSDDKGNVLVRPTKVVKQ
uniref:PKD domain-containing protein n=1 Tax=Haliscomenobacter sp. TaxID=2717303 RepID=UPI0033652BDA